MGISGSQKALMQARSGIARAGAYRAGYFTPNVVLLIGGVDYSAYIEDQSLTIAQVINNNPDTAQFTLLPTANFIPVAGQPVVIALGQKANAEFAGQIQRATRRYVGAIATPWIDVECIDYQRLMDRRIVNTEYFNQSATFIASDLIDSWTSGFTRANVAANLPTIDDFPVTNIPVSQALKQLATLIDGEFYIDARRDLHFFGVAGDTGPKAGTNPKTLTTALMVSSASQPGSLKSFAFTADVSQQRTRAIVEGKSTTCPIGTPAGAVSVTLNASASVDYLIVAGGGAGGAGAAGGGGGGGGAVVQGTDTITASTLSVVVGGGAAAVGGDGSASSFNGHSAAGGGGGGGSVSGHAAGDSGGNGGGGNGANAGGSGTQGFAGGNGDQSLSAAGGGGGGAGGVGGAAGPNTSGVGGPGVSSSLSGAPMYYGGGGGGNAVSGPIGSGGIGGGGHGGAGGNPSTPGTANTGGGGGGSQDNIAANQQGGSGIVILSYPTGALIGATGGSITMSGGRTIHTFTANGTFTVSNVTYAAPPALVTDLPLADASQIDANPGTVRIGNQVLSYLSTAGPIVAAGANPPGSTLSADAAVFDTSLHVADATQFTSAPGWVKAGDQIVRYASIGAGVLNGIPSIGFGALAAAVKSGASVTWLGSIVISNTGVTFSPALAPGVAVIQRVIVEDTTAEANVAAIEGGDGIHEYAEADGRLSITGATDRATANVTDFKTEIDTAIWATEDLNARPGRQQGIAFDAIATTLVITQVDVTFPIKDYLPLRSCQAATIRTAALLDAVVTGTN